MRVLRKIVSILVIAILVLVVVVTLAGVVLVRRPFPKVSGTIRVAGLDGPVQILRDEWGIPHIYARTTHDLFFAQGYVHAQDRLWQMEFNRRVAPGRLSEVLGEAALGNDRYLRTLGMDRAAEAEAERLAPEDRAALDAYAAGINAFLAEGHALPIEFTILGFKPQDWGPADSIGWGKVMAMSLGNNMDQELLRSALIEQVGEQRMHDLTPPYPADAPLIVAGQPGAATTAPEAPVTDGSHPAAEGYGRAVAEVLGRSAELRAWLGSSSTGNGSNNWVVSGARSSTGQPLLANDPHLGIQMPSIWYEIGLHCIELSEACPYQVVGSSFPGAPGVIIGHNPWIAWGVTTLPADVQDLYVEKVNPDNRNQVEYQGKWEDVQVRREEIRVKGRATPEVVEVRVTRHGPIVNDVVTDLKDVLALKWTALGDTPLLSSVLKLDRARNWDEFRAALSSWSIAHQNFVYADVEGNIGYQAAGLVPIRAKGDGLLPVPGWTGEYEWTGFIPYEQMPTSFNPPQGVILSANNRVIGDEYPYLLSLDWDNGYRARRIEEMLAAKPVLGAGDFAAIQGDDVVLPARQIVPSLAALKSDDERVQAAIDRLKAWDGRCGAGSVGCTLYQATILRLARRIFGAHLGPDLTEPYIGSEWATPALVAAVGEPGSVWWDDPSTPGVHETREEVMLEALAEATADLTDRLGSQMDGWTWGKAHAATFNHVMGGVKPLNLIFNRSVEAAGSGDAVNATGFDPSEPFGVSWLPSYRQIVNPANWSDSESMHTTGQSGLPFNGHYADMLDSWSGIRYHPMLWTDEEVQEHARATLVLQP